MPFIRLETRINAPIDLCFDLSRDLDVHMASAGPTRERAVAGVTSGMVKLGDEVTWEATHLGFRHRLTSKIIAYERPTMFIDEMLRGPFKRWRHKHLFEFRDGETLMIDEVDYASPFGVIGQLVDMLYLENYMKSFLHRRNTHIREVAESPIVRITKRRRAPQSRPYKWRSSASKIVGVALRVGTPRSVTV